MTYSSMLKRAIEKKKYSLTQVCFQLAKRDVWLDKASLSKIQNGKLPPAKDETNKVLAEILDIDSTKLRVAAIREIIPDDLIELIKKE
ncbi:hypothetical protein D3C87_1352800 [compost metagenome]